MNSEEEDELLDEYVEEQTSYKLYFFCLPFIDKVFSHCFDYLLRKDIISKLIKILLLSAKSR